MRAKLQVEVFSSSVRTSVSLPKVIRSTISDLHHIQVSETNDKEEKQQHWDNFQGMHQNLNKLQLPRHLILDHDLHSVLTSDWIGPHS